jgi:hypothetical protein
MSSEDHSISQAAVTANATDATPAGCSAAPAAFTGIDMGISGVGATLATVVKQLPGGRPSAKGYMSYGVNFPAPTKDDNNTTTS